MSKSVTVIVDGIKMSVTPALARMFERWAKENEEKQIEMAKALARALDDIKV